MEELRDDLWWALYLFQSIHSIRNISRRFWGDWGKWERLLGTNN